MTARTFAIGDVHGCLTALSALLQRVAPTADDTLVFLGDYVDRGPDSAAVIARLLELPQQCNAVFVKGNHEEMMLDARTDPGSWQAWYRYGGKQTLRSYGDGDGDFPACVPPEHWRFIKSGVNFHETETHISVHAPIRPTLPVAAQGSHDWRWSFDVPAEPHRSGKTVVCGHATQQDGLPMFIHGTYFIDTWACGDGWLTALELGEGRAIQARQDGEVRELAEDAFRRAELA